VRTEWHIAESPLLEDVRDMNQPTLQETHIVGGLPHLDLQIVHREHPDEPAESLSITIKAKPGFESAVQMLAPLATASLATLPTSPMAFSPFAFWTQWAQAAQAAWQPMLQSMQMPFALLQSMNAQTHSAGSKRDNA